MNVSDYLGVLWEVHIGQTLWTGYPFAELGEPPFKRADIKPVVLLSWDGDKYAGVQLTNGRAATVKTGYLFETAEAAIAFETRND